MDISKKLFRAIALMSDLYIDLFIGALGIYFVVVVGNFSGEKLTYFVVDCIITIAVVSCASWIVIWKMLNNILSDVENPNIDVSKTKERILQFPLNVGLISVIKMILIVSLITLSMAIQFDITSSEVTTMMLVIPMVFFADFNIAFFNTENSLAILLKSGKIINAIPNQRKYRIISLNMRIMLIALSLMSILIIIFGYILFQMNSQKLVFENLGFHVTFILVMSLAIIVVSLLLMAKNIKQSVGSLMTSLESIKNGDFTISGVPMLTSSELGILSLNANELFVKLSGVIINVKNTSKVVSTSSATITEAAQSLSQAATEQATNVEEMASSIEEMSSTTEEISSSMEEMSASMEEMSSMISQNAQNAKKTDEIAQVSSNQASEGGKAVAETVEAMRQIRQKVNLIEDIAAKTDLLALNAAIEAARAGEYGKGFAVVASEIRKLAERSQVSAKEIVDLIMKSVEVSERAGSLLNEIVPGIKKTADLVQDITDASIQQDTGVAQINTNMIQINEGMEQINTGMNQINTGMGQLNSVTQQNASSAEELASTADTLAANANELRELMDYFKMAESNGDVPGSEIFPG
jgi:X-X-X-Leu-X-X-Gly heptad repeat protein